MLNKARILDLTWVLGGPFAGQTLAQLGAEVIKIEPPEGDSSRGVPVYRFDGDSSFFLSVNRGKSSVCIDLKQPAGREAFYDLVRISDAVVYGFAPDVPARLGLDFESLRKVNPRIGVAQLIGLHDAGEYARAPAYDLIVQAMGGVMSITGSESSEPCRVGYQIADLAGGLYLALAACGVLYQGAREGKAAHAQISLLDCQLALLTWQAQNHFISGDVPRRMGSRNPMIAPSEAFLCSDGGYLAISPTGEHFWPKLCDVIGRPELATDPRFSDRGKRVENVEALVAELSEVFAGQSADHWAAALFQARVPAGKVMNVAEAVDQPLARLRNMVESVEKPETGNALNFLGNPFKYAAQRPLDYPPALGSATRRIFQTLCAYPEAKIDQLVQSKVLFTGEQE
ncbi:Formyl-coenzyme A transferase [Pigmentiphaga humi]|uniref:Formyl-coenzyme A transferase n=1 Tax=Pigmentiphaga humi TaxID=2478468 RepID=A0A3P4AY98_9BURK|nr:CoA transferase [Pigmentiphaga humi]VCU68762.1 Formyl-coenzyme A transferase [Pigmentiphaga humi]